MIREFPAIGGQLGFDRALQTQGQARWQFIPGTVQGYWEMDMIQSAANFAPMPLNTVANINGKQYYLVEESPTRVVGLDKVMWTRTFAPVFTRHFDGEQFVAQIPGGIKTLAGGHNVAIAPNTLAMTCEVRYDYFLLGVSTNDLPDWTVNFADDATIPPTVVPPITWVLTTVEKPSDITIFYPRNTATANTTGGPPNYLGAIRMHWPDAVGTIYEYTSWSQAQYSYVLSNWQANDWQLVAEPSVVTRWKGNMFRRATKYIRPFI